MGTKVNTDQTEKHPGLFKACPLVRPTQPAQVSLNGHSTFSSFLSNPQSVKTSKMNIADFRSALKPWFSSELS